MSDGPVGGPADNPPSPASPPAWRWRLPGPWRVGTALVLLMGSVLLIVSENSSGGTDLRPGRYNDLASLVNNESRRVKAQQAQVAALTAEVEDLTAGVENEEADETRRQANQLRGVAGLEPVTGPGVTVTLSDAPIEDINALSTDDLNPFVVHQQDIQAVVNAMWAGGAEAVTLQGQRITSSTGIKCVGNSVLLQGVAYPPPYVVSAIGDAGGIVSRVDQDPSVQLYLNDVDTYQLGWDLQLEDELTFPAYDGPIDTEYAHPAAPDDGT